MENKLKVEYVDIDTIKPYKNNAKLHPKEQIEQIKKSIENFGMNDPVGIWNNEIVEGHGRILACKELGYKQIPVIKLDHLTDEERKSYIIAHNKLTMNSDFDIDVLRTELENLKELDFDLELTGFNIDELDELFKEDEEEQEIIEDDFDIEPPEEPKAKLGDIYQLGNHRLMCGDSTNIDDINKLLNGNKIDMVYTDAPYGISVVGNNNTVGGGGVTNPGVYKKIKGDDTTDTAKDFYNNCVNIGIDNFILWGGNYFTDFLPFSPSWLIWDKRVDMNSNNFADGEMAWCSFKTPVRIYHQLWNGMIREGEHEDRVHPTQKPVRMQTEILKDFTNENDNILDGFGGSGSTLMACEQTNRNCFMIEYEPSYVDVIINRWENFTGKKAVKLNE